MAEKNDIVKIDTEQSQPLEKFEDLILVIRGNQVMLDRDLAQLYGVEYGRIVKQDIIYATRNKSYV